MTHNTTEVEEMVEEIGNLLQTGEYDKAIAYLHQQLQKVHREERKAFCTILEKLYQVGDDRKQMTFEYLMRIRSKDAVKTPDQAELDNTSPVYKFFTAPEEVRRPAIEEAIKKASQEQSELERGLEINK